MLCRKVPIFAQFLNENVMISILKLVFGLTFILVGANALTDGSAAIAKRLNVSDLVIGLTIVAFGTSAPELVISILSALNGSAPMAVGNVVGSNIFNVLAIGGCTAMVTPIVVGKGTIRIEMPFVIAVSALLFLLVNHFFLFRPEEKIVTTPCGIILLIMFAAFLVYTFVTSRKGNSSASEEGIKQMPLIKSIAYVTIGLTGLIVGGNWFVSGAQVIAKQLGASDAVIGLTLVAGGTSLPELATSMVAAVKKKSDLAIGNVIGSNVFNILLVLGCSATITPLPLGDVTNTDLLVMVGSAIALWGVSHYYKQQTISRIEGFFLFSAYIIYILTKLY